MKTAFYKLYLLLFLGFSGIYFAQQVTDRAFYDSAYNDYYDENYNYPEEYYDDYPTDFYTDLYYKSYYNDYRNMINRVNWNRFFKEYRLLNWQVREVVRLNNRFNSYQEWFMFYRRNPDRWYYDRFVALERIFGPHLYSDFCRRYYNTSNPIVYFQKNRTRYNASKVYVSSRYWKNRPMITRNDKFRRSEFRDDRQNSETSNTNLIDSRNSFRNSKFQNVSKSNEERRKEITPEFYSPNPSTPPKGFRSSELEVQNIKESEREKPTGGFRNNKILAEN